MRLIITSLHTSLGTMRLMLLPLYTPQGGTYPPVTPSQGGTYPPVTHLRRDNPPWYTPKEG